MFCRLRDHAVFLMFASACPHFIHCTLALIVTTIALNQMTACAEDGQIGRKQSLSSHIIPLVQQFFRSSAQCHAAMLLYAQCVDRPPCWLDAVPNHEV
jgi:hypothetical protein